MPILSKMSKLNKGQLKKNLSRTSKRNNRKKSPKLFRMTLYKKLLRKRSTRLNNSHRTLLAKSRKLKKLYLQ